MAKQATKQLYNAHLPYSWLQNEKCFTTTQKPFLFGLSGIGVI